MNKTKDGCQIKSGMTYTVRCCHSRLDLESIFSCLRDTGGMA
jgi:hypothetical protein